MHEITHFMAADHRACDAILANADRAVAARDWDGAAAAFTQFQTAVLQHFTAEESVIFPAFEEKTGMRSGPTQVMRGEHVQIRELMDAAREALAAQDADTYSGYADTLLIMLQQHNLKEENVLYPLCDQQLSGQTGVLMPRLHAHMPDRAE